MSTSDEITVTGAVPSHVDDANSAMFHLGKGDVSLALERHIRSDDARHAEVTAEAEKQEAFRGKTRSYAKGGIAVGTVAATVITVVLAFSARYAVRGVIEDTVAPQMETIRVSIKELAASIKEAR